MLGWFIYTVIKVKDSLQAEFRARGWFIDGDLGYNVGPDDRHPVDRVVLHRLDTVHRLGAAAGRHHLLDHLLAEDLRPQEPPRRRPGLEPSGRVLTRCTRRRIRPTRPAIRERYGQPGAARQAPPAPPQGPARPPDGQPAEPKAMPRAGRGAGRQTLPRPARRSRRSEQAAACGTDARPGMCTRLHGRGASRTTRLSCSGAGAGCSGAVRRRGVSRRRAASAALVLRLVVEEQPLAAVQRDVARDLVVDGAHAAGRSPPP